MRQIHNYNVSKESFDDMVKANRFNPCLEITFRDKSGEHINKIGAGYDDVIHIYREYTEIYLLSLNPGLGYVGLEVFEGSKKVGRIFLQGDQVKEVLGKVNLAPFNIIKKLREHMN